MLLHFWGWMGLAWARWSIRLMRLDAAFARPQWHAVTTKELVFQYLCLKKGIWLSDCRIEDGLTSDFKWFEVDLSKDLLNTLVPFSFVVCATCPNLSIGPKCHFMLHLSPTQPGSSLGFENCGCAQIFRYTRKTEDQRDLNIKIKARKSVFLKIIVCKISHPQNLWVHLHFTHANEAPDNWTLPWLLLTMSNLLNGS